MINVFHHFILADTGGDEYAVHQTIYGRSWSPEDVTTSRYTLVSTSLSFLGTFFWLDSIVIARESIKFCTLSEKEILKISEVLVCYDNYYNDLGEPEANGLLDPHMVISSFYFLQSCHL